MRLTLLKICCLLIMASLVSFCVSVSGQSSGMREVQNKPQADRPAPAECVAAFRQFFAYIKKNEPDIVTDEKAQNRWLTERMREAFVEPIKRSGNPKENPDYPYNSVFVGVWSRPTTYSIVGSRHYDFRNKENPNDN